MADTLYHERRRLDASSGREFGHAADTRFYQDAQRRLGSLGEREVAELCEQMALRFADEVAGTFDDRTYELSTSMVPGALGALLSATRVEWPRSPERAVSRLHEHIVVQGATDRLAELSRRGTLLVTPTHVSHLDSIVLGYTWHRLGLRPLLYGAGLNLFENPLISYFMNHLGAYKVDRKKKAELYKEVLKEFATVSIEYGYDNLFFPGGTRSRSGAVETHLKRGLLGTGLAAYQRNLAAGAKHPKVWVVPCTISYALVLEAETLIADHLQEVGKARYIIQDDEFTKPQRILSFLSGLWSLEARVIVTFSEPLDLVGNDVDERGESIDAHGRAVPLASYITRDGELRSDAQRDSEYTNELARGISRRLLRDNVILPTHLTAAALWRLLRRANPELDQYRLLRTGGEVPSFALGDVADECDRLLRRLERSALRPRLGAELQGRDARTVVERAAGYFATYHRDRAAWISGDRVHHGARPLLHYYANRLAGYPALARGATP